MSANTYKVTGMVDICEHAPGAEFEHAFGAGEERDLIEGGRIAIVSRLYRVVGTTRVSDSDPGGTFFGAYGVAQEAALIEGGHIERCDPRPQDHKPSKPAAEPPAPSAAPKKKE